MAWPFSWLRPDTAAGHLETFENIGLVVAGALGMLLMICILRVITGILARHWRLVVALSAIAIAVGLIIL